MYTPKVGGFDLDNYHMTYRLQGQVFLGEGTPVIVKPGESIHIGEGSKVIIGQDLPEHGIVLEGGRTPSFLPSPSAALPASSRCRRNKP